MKRTLVPSALLFFGLVSACRAANHEVEQRPLPAAENLVHSDHPGTAPIDCPLRKAGVDASHLRPFEEVEEYIAFLERPDRESWQRPKAVVDALHLKGDETITDVGAGSGYFSFRFALALPNGRVHAVDIEPEMVRHIHHQVLEQGASNLSVAISTPDDPMVDPDSDIVFVCDVMHHISGPDAWLAKLHGELHPGARLALIEFKEGDLPAGPPAGIKIPRAKLIDMVESAGFHLVEEQPDLLPYQTFMVFERN